MTLPLTNLAAAPAAVLYEDWDKKNNDPSDPFSGISSRPDFVGIIYPGPSPFARNRTASVARRCAARLWRRKMWWMEKSMPRASLRQVQ